ncbi:MAG: hypothetical protein WBD31_07210 [Rubripirellula sp.]
MNRFSLRTLLVAVTVVALTFWVLTIPRGNINRSTARLLEPGMTLDEASELIGVDPGWHDGIYGLSGGVVHGDKLTHIVPWVNLRGAITAEVTGNYDDLRIVSARFTPRSEFTARFYFSEMLYDRTFKPVVDSQSPIATICILLGCVLFPMIPSLIIGAFTGVARNQLIGIGLGSALIAYFVIVLSLNDFWMGHHEVHFGMIAKAIGLIAFVSTVLFACFGRIFRHHDVDADDAEAENHGVHRSTA